MFIKMDGMDQLANFSTEEVGTVASTGDPCAVVAKKSYPLRCLADIIFSGGVISPQIHQ